jgi:hypothetical protein
MLENQIQSLTIRQLETANSEKDKHDKFLRHIQRLYKGGKHLIGHEKDILVPRSGETPQEFARRLALFDYVNVLGGAINELVSKFSWGDVALYGTNILSDSYERFHDSLSPKQWLPSVLREALKVQTVYAVIEPIEVRGTLKNDAVKRAAFKNFTPEISTYYPPNVMLEGDGWIKIQSHREVMEVTGVEYKEVKVRYIDSKNYYTFIYHENKDKQYRLPGMTAWTVSPTEVRLTPTIQPVIAGRYPVFKFKLPDEKYVANQVYLQQHTHTRLYNAAIDAGAATGQVYRWITPLKESSTSALPTALQDDVKLGNTTVVEAEKLGIVETSGSAIRVLLEQLHDIEKSIKSTVALSGISYNDTAMKQSGVSKALDNLNLESSLREFGMLICSFYQDIINYYALLLGDTVGMSVEGYSDFNLDSVDSALDVLERVSRIPDISVEVKAGLVAKAENLLAPNSRLDATAPQNDIE